MNRLTRRAADLARTANPVALAFIVAAVTTALTLAVSVLTLVIMSNGVFDWARTGIAVTLSFLLWFTATLIVRSRNGDN